jgi:hypothetical protein
MSETTALKLKPLDVDSFNRVELYSLYKLSLQELIDDTFGWNQEDQRARFE